MKFDASEVDGLKSIAYEVDHYREAFNDALVVTFAVPNGEPNTKPARLAVELRGLDERADRNRIVGLATALQYAYQAGERTGNEQRTRMAQSLSAVCTIINDDNLSANEKLAKIGAVAI